MTRRIVWQRLIIAAVAAFASYLGLCIAVLAELSEEDLVQMRVLEYQSPAEPVVLPMPAILKNLYWNYAGEDRVLRALSSGEELLVFARQMTEHSEALGQQVNSKRATDLLNKMNEALRKDSMEVNDAVQKAGE